MKFDMRKIFFLLLCLTLLSGFKLARGVSLAKSISVPPRPQWHIYKTVKQGKGMWISNADSDTLFNRNIRDLQRHCDKLEAAIRIHNGGR